jgi:outer membrane protein TolC
MVEDRKHAAMNRSGILTVLAAALAIGLCGCSQTSLYGGPAVAPAPETPWTPPAEALAQPSQSAPPPPIPPELAATSSSWGLAEIVDVALRTSSQTRAAWASARSAAAAYGSERGSYYPQANVSANRTVQKGVPGAGRTAAIQRWVAGTADVTWMLFNFGGRHAAVEETRQALLAADWTHNAVIQNVVLEVEQAYYEYVTARALLEAEEATQAEAKANLDAAQDRHTAGLATVADVLQAQTALSQVGLSVETLRGRIAVTRGALATSMGLPANTPFDVDASAMEPPSDQAVEDVESYLAEARANRPDLAAARAQVREADAHVGTVKAQGLPTLSATGGLGRFYPDAGSGFNNTFSAVLQLRMPLFTGFSHHYDVQRSRADADLARARLQTLEQAVTLQVWTSYYGFKTAQQRLKSIEDLLRSATASQDVARGRYQAGVGTILDLLAAQAALEQARGLQVQARADWYVSLAQLAHDTGALGPSTAGAGEGTRKEAKP